jgi:hypothetical protein
MTSIKMMGDGTVFFKTIKRQWNIPIIYTKRCLQNIGTSPNHVFYLLDDRGVRGFSARRLCYNCYS